MEQHQAENIGVALRMPEEVSTETELILKEISEKASTVFLVDGISMILHITIFQGLIPSENISKIRSVCEDTLSPLSIKLGDKLFFFYNGNIFWNAVKTQELQRTHESVMKRLHLLTEGLVMDQFKEILDSPDTSVGDKENIKKYGVVLAGERFLPHITLAKLTDHRDKKVLENITLKPQSFTATKYIVGRLNEYGQITEIIESL